MLKFRGHLHAEIVINLAEIVQRRMQKVPESYGR